MESNELGNGLRTSKFVTQILTEIRVWLIINPISLYQLVIEFH
jgi:hypothetical protein